MGTWWVGPLVTVLLFVVGGAVAYGFFKGQFDALKEAVEEIKAGLTGLWQKTGKNSERISRIEGRLANAHADPDSDGDK